jgi:hypothetical protein
MTNTKKIITAVAFASIAFAAHAGTSAASESQISTFKPYQAHRFDVGQKHAVGYFYDAVGTCRLILTLADNMVAEQSFTATRHETSVPAGRAIRYTSDGHTFEFGCAAHAEAMTFKTLSTVASAEND